MLSTKKFTERILLMGPPGSGKTTQLINIARFITETSPKTSIYMIDLENKLQATLFGRDSIQNLTLYEALSWEELESIKDELVVKVKLGDWVLADRVDLIWSFVQRWYTQQKYKEELGKMMLKTAQNIKKSMMLVPRFDMGSWTIINENYEDMIGSLFYKTRANVAWTSGIQTDDTPIEMFGDLKVKPRGQKEIGHQPNSVFLLEKDKIEVSKNKFESRWYVTTAKDVPSRDTFDREELFDFALQYLAKYL